MAVPKNANRIIFLFKKITVISVILGNLTVQQTAILMPYDL